MANIIFRKIGGRIVPINKAIDSIKVGTNTYKATKAKFHKKTGKTLSKSLFGKGVTQDMMNRGMAFSEARLIGQASEAQARLGKSQIKKLKKARKNLFRAKK